MFVQKDNSKKAVLNIAGTDRGQLMLHLIQSRED
jgi:hypothetical protein